LSFYYCQVLLLDGVGGGECCVNGPDGLVGFAAYYQAAGICVETMAEGGVKVALGG